jgi:hypothetical protein
MIPKKLAPLKVVGRARGIKRIGRCNVTFVRFEFRAGFFRLFWNVPVLYRWRRTLPF